MKPTDIAHLVSVGAPTLSPDGRTAVVAASHPDLEANEGRSQLWLVPLDGSGGPRELTHGKKDAAPRYSPDGHWLAFLRPDDDGKPQLHLMHTGGGDPRPVTSLPGGAGAAAWSPDGTTIAFSARVPEAGRYGQDEKVPAEKEPPRRITGLQYRLDGTGFLIDQREQVFVLDVSEVTSGRTPESGKDPEPTQLTEGDYESGEVTWSPDGQWLAFTSARHDAREHDLNRDVFVVHPDGSGLRQVTDTGLWIARPAFSRDGRTIVFLAGDPGPTRTSWFATQQGLYVIAADADHAAGRRLTDAEKYNLVDAEIVFDGDDALVLNENRGAVDLLAVPLAGGEPVARCAGKRQLGAVAVAGVTTVVTYKDAATFGELAVLRDGKPDTLTDFGAELRKTLLPIEDFTAEAADGTELHGFVVLPDGEGPHPVLLMIHGGPFTQYGWQAFDEAQVYARAGYAVVYTNPRGSSGYGAAYGAWIRGDVGAKSAADLFALLDKALERPELDGSRLGVLGGSHGGYMTSWLVGHSDRFAAAVSERGLNAINSFTGSSDIGWGFSNDLYGSDAAEQHRQSPLTAADDISTPLLIIHSEHDWRCPVEQGQRLYVELRNRDAEVELLLFPGEGHELSRSGVPSHRVARFEAILEWFGRYLHD